MTQSAAATQELPQIAILRAAVTAARGGDRPQGGCWTLGRLGDAIADVLQQTIDGYATEVENDPECPSCGSAPCGPHPAIEFHDACQEPVEHCTCIAPSLQLARVLLGTA